jgi:hypothetical protein
MPDKLIKSNEVKFEKYLFELHEKTNVLKQSFLASEFDSLIKNPSTNDVSIFILQFLPFLDFIMFFGNEKEVKNKLSKLGFTNNVIKWFVSISEIENEINRLRKIDGLLFIPYNFLFASTEYIRIKFKIELVEGFGLNILHNNIETNTIFLDISNRYRRNNYKRKKSLKPNKTTYDILMNLQIENFEKISTQLGNDKDLIIKNVLKTLNGNTRNLTDLFEFVTVGISENNAYCELFPLLKLIMKDVKMLDETEFYSGGNDKYYDGVYRTYKFRRVQKLLQKK